jgi:5-(aminomethyl)-3-furanmethanol phosphate kinase
MIRVIKVGGSLLDWPPLPAALQTWLNDQPPAFNILLAGGGAFVDAIRQADRSFSLGEEVSHRLSVDALSVSARLLAALLPNIRLLSTYQVLQSAASELAPPIYVIFDPNGFLKKHESRLPGDPLPHNWTVSSDSIAARLALVLQADELILLKSTDPPKPSLVEMAAAGYIDSHLPIIASDRLSLRFVNLRLHP